MTDRDILNIGRSAINSRTSQLFMEFSKITRNGEQSSKSAVVIRNAYKRYSPQTVILNGLNMTVPAGNIYCLLGPSGCGKTSLLRCIIGQIALDSGSIEVCYSSRSQIGYMPQALSLHLQLTVLENIFFYGYLFGMSTQAIEDAMSELITRLDLPSKFMNVSDLSGGEQRRVSMAVTFIHNSSIVILDEPTVGLDIQLVNSIWNWLLEMASAGKTIIITTHYIQEAYHSHKAACMRKGILLCEESPDKLLQELHCDSLDDVFLKLSYVQEMKPLQENTEFPEKTKPIRVHCKEDGKILKRHVRAVMYKNTRLMCNDYRVILYMLCISAFSLWITNYSIGGRPNVAHVAVVNEEILTSECDSFALTDCFLNESKQVHLSCIYLEFLRNRNYIIVDYPNKSFAEEDIRNREVIGLLHFSKNYTRSLSKRIESPLDPIDEEISESIINAWIDSSDPILGQYFRHDFRISLRDFLRQIVTNCELNANIGSYSIRYETPVHGSFNVDFKTNVFTVVMGLSGFSSSTLAGMLYLYTEKTSSVNERITATGVSMSTIIVALLFILIVVIVIPVNILMLLIYLYSGYALQRSLFTMILLLILHGISGLLFGFAAALTFKSLIIASFTGGGQLIIMSLVSGIMWPTELQHENLKSMHWIFLGYRMTEAVQSIVMKNFPFSHPLILSAFGWILTHIITLTLFLCFIIKYKT